GGSPLPAAESGYHLYSSYAFKNETRTDGTVMDQNAVWFAAWYLDNLNGLFPAPLDYPLWPSLAQASPIPSRLYEFLFLNFHTGLPALTFNYASLARMLPV